MARRRISKFDLEEDVKGGLSVSEIARKREASKSTISERLKSLGLKPVVKRGNRKGLVVSQGGNKGPDAIIQLRKINAITLEILQKAMDALREDSKAGEKIKNPLALVFKAMSQVESQIKTEFSILEGLHSMEVEEADREFREEVLEVIGEVEPNVKKEIVKRLQERREARSFIARA